MSGPFHKLFIKIKEVSFEFVNISIIHNIGMEKDIKRFHSKYIILGDKIPDMSYKKNSVGKYIVYISSFAVDEPFDEIFDVAESLPDDYKIYWTGHISEDIRKRLSKKSSRLLDSKLIFTGYLKYADYSNLIGNAQCLLALTNEEDCLQCGAFEALSVNVPIVISDTQALRSSFLDSAIYTAHSKQSILSSLNEAINSRDNLKRRMHILKEKYEKVYSNNIMTLKKMISSEYI